MRRVKYIIMNNDLIEVMILDIDRNAKRSWGERSECGIIIDSSPIPYEECMVVKKIYDWKIDKQMRCPYSQWRCQYPKN